MTNNVEDGFTVNEISVHEAHSLLQRGNPPVTLIDIRSRGSALGHIEGAHFISAEDLENASSDLPADKNSPILLYCASGILSSSTVRILQNMGYTNVHSIQGGFNAWRDLGFEVATDTDLTSSQLDRYSRNMLLEEVGSEGQARLLSASVLLVGAGGLGSPASLYLAAAGVGTIGIADFDTVELSNLNRQVVHGTADVGRLKTESARDAIYRLNPEVRVVTYEERLISRTILDVIRNYDVVMEATDNIKSKFLLNDACFFAGKPYVFGGAVRFVGQASVFHPKEGGGCLRCLFPRPPEQSLSPT
jgi:molybdopterin/thiamine biosynthesis adenylyltransferase/rhodanese-related sulfurtransferase